MSSGSTEGHYIEAIRAAIVAAGIPVFDNILDHHTGVRTKSRTYVQIARSWERQSDEVAYNCIQGPFTYKMRLHYSSNHGMVINNTDEAEQFANMSEYVEKTISAVKPAGIFNFPNIQTEEVTTTSMRGRVRDYTISGIASTARDRSGLTGPPVNTVPPVISGSGGVGDPLTSDTGTWTGTADIVFEYDWLADGVSVEAENSNTYIVELAYAGQTISCEVTAENGIIPNGVSESNGILAQTPTAPSFTTEVTLIPTAPETGDILTASGAVAAGFPTPVITYQWYKDDGAGGAFSPIVGETSQTYQTVQTDGNYRFYVIVTATNVGGVATSTSGNVFTTEVIYFQNFESPVVTGYEKGSKPTDWVLSNIGFGADRVGLNNIDSGDWGTQQVGNEQVISFKYSNSGASTAEGSIEDINIDNVTYTISADVTYDKAVTEGNASGWFDIHLCAFDGAVDRQDFSALGESIIDAHTIAELSSGEFGEVPNDDTMYNFSKSYTTNLITDAALLNHEIAVSVAGASGSGMVDNIKITKVVNY